MLKSFYMRLLRNKTTRLLQRRLLRRARTSLGCSDAYGELFSIVNVTPSATVLDIGAYIGDTVLRFLDETTAHIHAFEPTPQTVQRLQQRYQGEPRVTVHPLALSDTNGTRPDFASNANAQTNSLLANDVGNVQSFAAATATLEQVTVRTQTLDTWMAEHGVSGPLVVKADIQGAEGMLLDGGERAFCDHIVAFFSEAQLAPMYKNQIDFHQLNELMTSRFGFYLANIYAPFRDSAGRAVQVDALWLR